VSETISVRSGLDKALHVPPSSFMRDTRAGSPVLASSSRVVVHHPEPKVKKQKDGDLLNRSIALLIACEECEEKRPGHEQTHSSAIWFKTLNQWMSRVRRKMPVRKCRISQPLLWKRPCS